MPPPPQEPAARRCGRERRRPGKEEWERERGGERKKRVGTKGGFLHASKLRVPHAKIPLFLCADISSGPLEKLIVTYGSVKEPYGKIRENEGM